MFNPVRRSTEVLRPTAAVFFQLVLILLCLAFAATASADPVADALDQPLLTFSTTDNAYWTSQKTVTHDGSDALKVSGVGGGIGAPVNLSVTVTGDATVSFFWRLVSENTGDLARFQIDGVEQPVTLNAPSGWKKVTAQTGGPGEHTLVWSYSKTSPDTGKDALYLDELRIQQKPATGAPVLLRQSTAAQASWGRNVRLEVEATGGALAFQWYEGENGDTSHPVLGATSPNLLTPPVTENKTYWVRVSNLRGSFDSATAAVTLLDSSPGTLKGMGDGEDGQLGPDFVGYLPRGLVPEKDVASVAAGFRHSLFIRTDGSLWGMGRNHLGQLGDGTTIDREEPIHIADGVSKATAGFSRSLFLKTDGTLWAMGENGGGQLGDGTEINRLSPVQIATEVASVSAGSGNTLFIKTDGSLWTFGSNFSGELGDGTTTPRSTPAMVATGVRQAASGTGFSIFLKTDGTLWGMGDNTVGQLGNNPAVDQLTPVQIATDVANIAAGGYETFFIKNDGTMWKTGERVRVPEMFTTNVAKIAAGYQHTLLLKTDGSLWTYGSNEYGQLGDGFRLTSRTVPAKIADGVADIAAGGYHSLFVGTDGMLWGMGAGLSAAQPTTSPSPAVIQTETIQMAAGSAHTLFLKSDGTLWAIGQNEAGQLGDGTTVKRARPVQTASDVRQAAAGGNISLFIKNDFSLWLSGYTGVIQVGTGSPTTARATPFQIGTEAAFVAARDARAYVITRGGSLRQLDTSLNNAGQTVEIATGVAQVAPGDDHLLFLKTDGSLWTSGNNQFGQLGDGSKTWRGHPLPVARDVVRIAAGAHHSLFLKADGSLWGMGLNYYGELGAGSPSSITTPVQIASDVAEIAAGLGSTFFIKTDRSVWAVGRNERGQLGDGTEGSTADRATPVQISTNGMSIATGLLHSLLLTGPHHRVTFDLGAYGTRSADGALVQYVPEGSSALAPSVTPVDGQVFVGWEGAFDAVLEDLTIHARYLQRQVITFSVPASIRFTPGTPTTFTPTATASSGLPVIFQVRSGPATIGLDGVVTITDAGNVTLVASQPGDATWASATPVQRTISVTGNAQKITFPQPAASTYGAEPFALSATASSGLPVAFTVVSGPAIFEDGKLTVTEVGKVVIQADQSGGDGFSPAPAVRRTLVVGKALLTVRAEDASRLVGEANPAFALTYTGFVGEDAANTELAILNLQTPPTASVKATKRSSAGTYPITISGGLDDHYTFVAEKPPGLLTVRGFGGTYEALITNGEGPGSIPLGKLTLTLPSNALSYTGRLTLAAEAKTLIVTSASADDTSGPFTDFGDGDAVIAQWFTGDASDSYLLSLKITSDGILTGTLKRDGAQIAILAHGSRLYDRADTEVAARAGRYTMLFYPASGMFEFSGPAPRGFGYATATISGPGTLAFKGKLADGTPITSSVRATTALKHLLWHNVYPARPGSFLAGPITLSSYPEANPLVWKQTPVSDDPAAEPGFGHLRTGLAISRWLPPVAAGAGRPATSLPQRLGLADTAKETGIVALYHESNLIELSELPVAALIYPSGKSTAEYTTTKWKISINSTLGTFDGSFEMPDPTGETTVRKTVRFSGALRPIYEGDTTGVIGGGFLVFPTWPSMESVEPHTGQIRLYDSAIPSP